MIEELAKAAIVGDPTLAALIGTRCYYHQLPQNVIKQLADPQSPVTNAITSSASQLPAAITQDGDTGLAVCRLSIVVWDTDVLQCDAIANRVKSVIRVLNGTNGGNQRPNSLLMDRPGIEPNTVPQVFKRMLDFRVWYDTNQ